MKIVNIIFITLVSINLFGITFVDESQYADHIVGNKHLKGAKFLGGTIWQDQPINNKVDAFTYYEAKKYCANLNLLGIKKWRLPIKTDFMILDKDMKKLRYTAGRANYFSWYFTQTPVKGKPDKVYAADISTNRFPYITTTKKRYKNSLRCVLNPNIYNAYQIEKAKKMAKGGSIDAYLSSFLKSGNKTYLKQAIKHIKTKLDRAKVEAALYKYLGFLKLFDVIKDGEIIDKNGKDYDSNNRLLAAMQKSKKLKYRFSIRPKKNSSLKLKYNTYKVTLEFKLDLKYDQVAMGIGTSVKKSLYVDKTFVLSSKNHYSKNITVDFGAIEQGTKARMLILNYSKKLTKAVLSYSVKDTQIELLK